jgi:hypothetical protein
MTLRLKNYQEELAARELIENCLLHAFYGFLSSIVEKNSNRANYWIERIVHLDNELDWIDQIINEIN